MKFLRILRYLCALVFSCVSAGPAWAQCPPRTTVSETLYNADGSLADGRVVIAWQAFAIGACQVAAGQATVNVIGGAFTAQLYANDVAVPGGTSYRVTYYLKSGRVTTEYWVVPTSPTAVGLSVVRSATVPVPNVMFSQAQVTNLAADLTKKVELPTPCPAGRFLQANGSALPPQVDCVDVAGGGGGSGAVTSVGLAAPAQFSVGGSPVTSSGTLGLAWVNQNANLIFAGPASGAAAAPAFRPLVAADIPPLDASKIATGSLGDARVDDNITLANLTQITTRDYSALQNIPSTFTPSSHAIDGAVHSASGLTAGHFLKALSATTFGFAQITFANLSGSIAPSQQNNPAVGAKGGVEAKACSGTDKLSAIDVNGVPQCSADQTGGGANHNMLSATHTDSTAATVARGSIMAGIGASPSWTRVDSTTADRYFKRNSSGDIVESSSAAAGTGACTNQFVRGNNADAAPTCSTVGTNDLAANAVTDAKLRQSAGLSVVGRSANTTGDVADIAAGSDGQVFRRSGTSIGFGAVDLASANAVTGVLPSGNLPGSVVYDTATVTRDFPLNCTNARVKSLAGNAWFDVEGFSTADVDITLAKFTNNVDGRITCTGFVPNELAGTPAAKVIFDVAPHVACGASQNFRFNIRYRFNGSTGNYDTALTAESEQSIAGATTAHAVTRATFPSSGSLSSAPSAGDFVIVEIQNNGASASDTCEQVKEIPVGSVKLRVDVKVKN